MNFDRKYNPYLTFHHENYLNPFMTKTVIIQKPVHWFLYDIGLRHERVKYYLLLKNTSSEFYSAFFCHGFHFIAFFFLIKQGFLLLLLLLLASYITVKAKTHFCSRNDSETSYAEDHGSYIEMTIAETNVDINL